MGERRRVVLGAVAIVQALDIYITFSTQISNLRLAEAAVLLGLPVVGANGGDGVEEVVGVVLVLDGLELGVVGAVEDVLPVGLPEVGLVEVSGAVRGELGERGHEYVGHLLLVGDHVFPGGGEVPGRGDDGVDEGVAPAGVDGVVGVAGGREGSVEGDTDELGALGSDGAVGVGQSSVVLLNDRTRDEAATVLGNANLDRSEHVVEEREVGVEVAKEAGVLDVQLVELVSERSEELLQLFRGDVGASQGRDGESLVGEVPHGHDTSISRLGKRGVESSNSLVVCILGHTGAGEGEVGTSGGHVLMGLGSQRQDNTVGTTSAAGESPVEVGVVLTVGNEVLTSTSDDLPLESLVSSHAVTRAERGVATTLRVATGNADGRALSANDLQTLSVGSLVGLTTKNTSTHLDGLATVVLIIPVLELDVLQVVHPKAEGAGTSALAVVVMASVADDKANVAVVGKLNASGDVGGLRDIDGVLDVGANHTSRGPLSEGVAAAVGEERSHDGGGVRVAGDMSDCTSN